MVSMLGFPFNYKTDFQKSKSGGKQQTWWVEIVVLWKTKWDVSNFQIITMT